MAVDKKTYKILKSETFFAISYLEKCANIMLITGIVLSIIEAVCGLCILRDGFVLFLGYIILATVAFLGGYVGHAIFYMLARLTEIKYEEMAAWKKIADSNEQNNE